MPFHFRHKIGIPILYQSENLEILHVPFTLEPEILYLAYLALEVTSPAIVGLNAFLASPNLP